MNTGHEDVKTILLRLHRWLVPEEVGLGFLPYLWLLFFGWFFVQWYFQTPGTLELVLALASTLAFSAIYFSGFRYYGRAALWHILALLALGLAWTPFNIGANVFYIFAAAFAHMVGPPRVSIWLIAAIVALAGLSGWLVQPFFFFWFPAMLGSFTVGLANIWFREQDRHRAELRLSQSEVRQLARVAERERIARDLHDLLGHRLSVIVLKSELARRLIDHDPKRAGEEIREVETSAREALAEVREAIGGYRQRSLAGELEQARLALRSADVELALDCDDALNLDGHTEAVLALVIREAVTNVIRHARARQCRIRLKAADDNEALVLEIRDDGYGGIRPEGAGIDGMRARIESLGGRMSIDPAAGRIAACLPRQAAT